MVKLDYEHDYYADLELPVTADAAEVKRQFKKLGRPIHLLATGRVLTRLHSPEVSPRSQPGQRR